MPDYGFLAQANNPFETVGKIAQVQNQVNQNKLFQGQQAAGAALQQSINPDTGLLDSVAYNRRIAANPQIAPYAADALTHGLDAQNKLIANTKDQTALNSTFTKNLTDDIAGQDPTQVPGILFRGVATGRYPQGVAEQFLGGGMEAGGKTFGQHAADLSKQAAIQSGSPTAMEAAFGSTDLHDTGPGLQGVNTNRVARTVTPVGDPIAKGLSPSEAASPVEVYGDVAHPRVTITKGQFAGATGSPGAPASAAPATAPLTLPGGVRGFAAAPPLGAEQGANDASHQGQIMAQGWVQAGDEAPTQRAALQQFERLLPQFQSGPAATYTKQLTTLAAQFGLAPPSFAKGAAAQEEASKLAFQIAQSQFRALGGTGTNAQLESVMHTSPNEFMSKLGNASVVALLKGNADAQQVKAKEWQAWQAARGPQSAQEFASYFNQHYDPLVFQSRYLTQPQFKELAQSMDKAEQAKFRQRYNEAVANGWIPHPGAQ